MGADKQLYLAYGSNLHPVRLRERVPSARLLRVVEFRGMRLAFHKRGADRSGKGNLIASRAGSGGAYGALYEMDARDKSALDRFEGAGYRCAALELPVGDTSCKCFIYLAESSYIDEALRPYHWYKALVLEGAAYLGLPGSYLGDIARAPSIPDPNTERARYHAALIGRMTAREDGPPAAPVATVIG